MKPKTSAFGILLSSIILFSALCSATMTVSVDTDADSYHVGDTVNFTGAITITGTTGGCCGAFSENNVSLAITDGSSRRCSLEAEEMNYDSGGGNCSLVMNVTETHATNCASYGGNNTIRYSWIYWTIPSGWDADSYTANLTAHACGSTKSASASFTVATTTTTTLHTISGGGGGGGGGSVSVAKPVVSCFDGILNCHDGKCEEGTDCGGPCKSCISCSDGVQNQGETGVDCGGPCASCKTTTTIAGSVVRKTLTSSTITTTTEAASATTTSTEARILATTTTAAASQQGIPLGLTEGAILFSALVLIALAFMIQTGKL
jgi:hypothetical protein